MVDDQNSKVAARLTHTVFFEEEDIDFTFQWLLSFARYGGVSQGELFKLLGEQLGLVVTPAQRNVTVLAVRPVGTQGLQAAM